MKTFREFTSVAGGKFLIPGYISYRTILAFYRKYKRYRNDYEEALAGAIEYYIDEGYNEKDAERLAQQDAKNGTFHKKIK